MSGVRARRGLGRFRGVLIGPEDPRYEDARRTWNPRFNGRPNLIARCRDTADVQTAVAFAREQQLPLIVRGGGHSYAGLSVGDGALVIDLSLMRGIGIDHARGVARVAGGCRWGDLDAAALVSGLAGVGGFNSTTGVTGVILGGGIGPRLPQYGLACDSLLAAQLVTADAEVVRVDAERDPDRLWALSGGGRGFGVVTDLELAIHPVRSQILAGAVYWPLASARRVLTALRDLLPSLPGDVSISVGFLTIHDDVLFEPELLGLRVVFASVRVLGAPDVGLRSLAPLLSTQPSLLDTIATAAYRPPLAGNEPGLNEERRYVTNGYLARLTDSSLDAVLAAAEQTSPELTLGLFPFRGAVRQVPPEATAFGDRGHDWMLDIEANWRDRDLDAERIAEVRALYHELSPLLTGRGCLNFLSENGVEAFERAYCPVTGDRLRRLSERYDPEMVFCAASRFSART